MPSKAYVCNRWPSLSIRHIKFSGGLYVAKTEEDQRLIESTDMWLVHIHPVDPPEQREVIPETEPKAPTAKAESVIEQITGGKATLGRRGTKG